MFLLTRCKSTPTVRFYLQGVRVHLQYVSTYKVYEYDYSIVLLARCKNTTTVCFYLQGVKSTPTVCFDLQGVRVRLQYVFTCQV